MGPAVPFLGGSFSTDSLEEEGEKGRLRRAQDLEGLGAPVFGSSLLALAWDSDTEGAYSDTGGVDTDTENAYSGTGRDEGDTEGGYRDTRGGHSDTREGHNDTEGGRGDRGESHREAEGGQADSEGANSDSDSYRDSGLLPQGHGTRRTGLQIGKEAGEGLTSSGRPPKGNPQEGNEGGGSTKRECEGVSRRMNALSKSVPLSARMPRRAGPGPGQRSVRGGPRGSEGAYSDREGAVSQNEMSLSRSSSTVPGPEEHALLARRNTTGPLPLSPPPSGAAPNDSDLSVTVSTDPGPRVTVSTDPDLSVTVSTDPGPRAPVSRHHRASNAAPKATVTWAATLATEAGAERYGATPCMPGHPRGASTTTHMGPEVDVPWQPGGTPPDVQEEDERGQGEEEDVPSDSERGQRPAMDGGGRKGGRDNGSRKERGQSSSFSMGATTWGALGFGAESGIGVIRNGASTTNKTSVNIRRSASATSTTTNIRRSASTSSTNVNIRHGASTTKTNVDMRGSTTGAKLQGPAKGHGRDAGAPGKGSLVWHASGSWVSPFRRLGWGRRWEGQAQGQRKRQGPGQGQALRVIVPEDPLGCPHPSPRGADPRSPASSRGSPVILNPESPSSSRGSRRILHPESPSSSLGSRGILHAESPGGSRCRTKRIRARHRRSPVEAPSSIRDSGYTSEGVPAAYGGYISEGSARRGRSGPRGGAARGDWEAQRGREGLGTRKSTTLVTAPDVRGPVAATRGASVESAGRRGVRGHSEPLKRLKPCLKSSSLGRATAPLGSPKTREAPGVEEEREAAGRCASDGAPPAVPGPAPDLQPREEREGREGANEEATHRNTPGHTQGRIQGRTQGQTQGDTQILTDGVASQGHNQCHVAKPEWLRLLESGGGGWGEDVEEATFELGIGAGHGASAGGEPGGQGGVGEEDEEADVETN